MQEKKKPTQPHKFDTKMTTTRLFESGKLAMKVVVNVKNIISQASSSIFKYLALQPVHVVNKLAKFYFGSKLRQF